MAFPRIDRVGEAYIGLLSGDQFINLVSTDDGELNRDLFFDNVRDFKAITLSIEKLSTLFPMNSFVTAFRC